MQFCRKVLCQPCSARVTSPEEDMEYKMGSCIGISRSQPCPHFSSSCPVSTSTTHLSAPLSPLSPLHPLYRVMQKIATERRDRGSSEERTDTNIGLESDSKHRLEGFVKSFRADTVFGKNLLFAVPEEGTPENVVLFPPQENQNDSLKGEAYTESLTQRDDRTLLTEPSTSQQSLLSQPVLPDVPVITGVEESRSTAGDQEDKGELEFPHDLLPSLDFSSELNIWESSLGTQTSSDERKCEQVNPLLAGLQHHMEVSRPLVVLDTRPHDCDPVLTDAQPSPRPTAPPSPTHLLLDRELQEAFKECEEQMASLGLLQLKEPLSTMSETVNEKEEKTGEAMVNKP
eukprot:superscaffoldBa00002913_g15636